MVGYKLNINKMIKQIFLIIITSLLLFQPVHSANALEGLIKFTGKNDATVFLEVADTPEKKTKGLMDRNNLAPNRGMVFIFKPAMKVTFWMKDTLIPLDMIFINDGKIVKIAKNTVPNQTSILYPSEFDVTEVVEVNSGFSDKHMISVGDNVSFENIAQIDYSKKSELMIVSK